ncbi:YbfB/YjiJ family MFS transporter [Pseudohoeflea coraliihabitans]|uniref:YbfB/YjiJ family MFS transporter n=1 Tax=Pseudohoeflea coraliihabitans TaxID=2860393 RepID=A0ABS6WM28_9HYPH|nr:YbfB/YjiJ family MFS transporter [Pseudohoeflea sp. DP4N28-3]MBW3096991.1 YbfB/YjiJ family MFS transporter [Pseudohoeflea sp. DP4N28-3]
MLRSSPSRDDRAQVPGDAFPWTIALAGALCMAVVMGLGRFFYTPVLPAMMSDLEMGPADAGFIASANYLGYLLGSFAAAYGWAEGIERRMVLFGLAMTAALLALMGLGSDVMVLSLVRLLAGIVSALVMVFSTALVLSAGPVSRRDDVQSSHFGGVGIGIAGSALLFAALIYAGGGWRTAWFAAAVLALLSILPVARYLPSRVLRQGTSHREPRLVWTPRLIALMLAYGIFGFGYIVTATFLVAIVREAGGSSSFEILVWLVTGLAGVPSVALGALAARRFGKVRTIVWACLIEAVGVTASVLLPLPAGPLIGGVMLGGTFILITAQGLQASRILAPESPRRVLATMTVAFSIGQILGPLVAGGLAQLTGNYVLASLSAVAALLMSAALYAAGLRDADVAVGRS